ncbi:hypothetical protein KFL_001830140 [Klebsormidium nitens]|uniref:Apple domain-containing protein n=1 Tax=Klebsormidium nitens TaxID=105231 RepID=A0A1Y1I6D8_KLENI|nr:hypothetical protein KFL_001830140 [Klebsormidium nitens]|eukprot:GAQ84286.1 hypothetical protein KFL_001830140 [Klebsormidium nitens]
MASITVRSVPSSAGVIFVFLLMGATFGLVSAQPPFTYLVQGGVDSFGNDFRPTAGPPANSVCGAIAYGEDATACEARCNATAACAGFIHWARNNCCFLKTQLVNPTVFLELVAHVKSPLGFTYSVMNATDYFGNDYFPFAGPVPFPAICSGGGYAENAAACEIRCNAASSCAGFVYYAAVNCCFLKTALSTATSNAVVESHVKTGYLGFFLELQTEYLGFTIVPPGVPTSNLCLYPLIAGISTGAQTQAIIESAAACVFRCNSTPGCIGISHYADRNCCFLKTTVSPLVPSTLVIRNANFYSKRAPAGAPAGVSESCPQGSGESACPIAECSLQAAAARVVEATSDHKASPLVD